MIQRRSLAERFHACVAVAGDDECWLWTASVNSKGYGQISAGGREGKKLGAHRVALMLQGRTLTPHDIVMHRCDTPACVNPRHLSVGSQLDNLRDMYRKGRNYPPALHAEKMRGRKRAPALVCKKGHDLSSDNVMIGVDGRRRCRICHRAKSLRGYYRSKEKSK